VVTHFQVVISSISLLYLGSFTQILHQRGTYHPFSVYRKYRLEFIDYVVYLPVQRPAVALLGRAHQPQQAGTDLAAIETGRYALKVEAD